MLAGSARRARTSRSYRSSTSLLLVDEDPTTEELRVRQSARAKEEREEAARADQDEETAQHERRADKAEYLKQKLAERSEAERDE